MPYLKAIHDTALKSSHKQKSELPSQEILAVAKGATIPYDSIERVGENHAKISAWVYLPHYAEVKIPATTHSPSPLPSTPPTSGKLPPLACIKTMPFLEQHDNRNHPNGTCNVTSLGMTLVWDGIAAVDQHGKQIEDRLYEWMIQRGLQIGSGYHLAECARAWGLEDEFDPPNATWGKAKEHLAKGNPIIAHGWFTRPGHIIVICGYDDSKNSWIVHDPWGEWFDSGYDTSVQGKFLYYSYSMMERLCGSDGDIWLHYIKSKKK